MHTSLLSHMYLSTAHGTLFSYSYLTNGSHLDFVLRTHHETRAEGLLKGTSLSRSRAPLRGARPGWVMAGGEGRASASSTSGAEQGAGETPSQDTHRTCPLPAGARDTTAPRREARRDASFRVHDLVR